MKIRPLNHLSVCVLASGSKGNAIHISDNETAILIDAGLSGKQIQHRMELKGLSPDNLNAIIVSHEHTDHIRGAGILCRRFNLPLYINQKTYSVAESKLGKLPEIKIIESGTSFSINKLKIHPFPTSHDAVDSSGFSVEQNGAKIGIATDLGIANLVVREHLKNCNLVIIESNHDPAMLLSNENYPWPLKQRVKSRKGHLANHETRELLSEIIHEGLSHIILAHLSEENNTPQKAHETVLTALNGHNIKLSVARQHEPGEIIKLGSAA